MKNSSELVQYKKEALKIYTDLTSSTGDLMTSTNYWQAGNVFDTVTDFMLLGLDLGMLNSDQIDSVMSNIKDNYDLLNYSYNGSQGNWYDDFGWWGIASSKAYTEEYSSVFDKYKDDFRSIAVSCHGIMTDGKPQIDKGAPNVWKNCDQQKYSKVEPYFNGGVWQYDIDKKSDPLIGSTKLGPYQLSVVNGLYFVLSLRMMDSGILVENAISNMHKFISDWCLDLGIKNGKSMLYRGGNPGGIVLERVPIYKNGDQVNPASWAQANTCWAGDQGLMMGGMAEYLLTNPDDFEARSLVGLISDGVPQNMISNKLIVPWYPIANNHLKSYDESDYSSGSGVFMRYLLYSYKKNATVKNRLDLEGSDLRNLVLKSADACANDTYPSYGNSFFDQFNKLSILTTAINILVD